MELFAPSAALLSLGIVSVVFLRRQSPFHLVSVLLGMTIIIGLYFPIGSHLVQPLTWRNLSGYSAAVAADIQWDYLAFGVGVLVAYGLFNEPETPIRSGGKRFCSSAIALRRTEYIVFALWFIGTVLYVAFVAVVGLGPLLSTDDFALKYRLAEGLGPLKVGLSLVIVACLLADASGASERLVRFARVVAVVVVIWGLFIIHVRTYPAHLIVGYMAIYCRRKHITIGRAGMSLLVAIAFIMIFFQLFTLYRGTLQTGVGVMDLTQLLAIAVGGSEFSHPFITAFELRRDLTGASELGRSYFQSLDLLAPRFIAPNRSEAPAYWFAREFYPSVAAVGGTAALSMVGEAWLNFGRLGGPFLVGAVFSTVLTRMEVLCDRRPGSFVAMTRPYMVLLVALGHRAAWIGTLKPAITVVLAVVFVTWSIDLMACRRSALSIGEERLR